jgi:hypothetical protein
MTKRSKGEHHAEPAEPASAGYQEPHSRVCVISPPAEVIVAGVHQSDGLAWPSAVLVCFASYGEATDAMRELAERYPVT